MKNVIDAIHEDILSRRTDEKNKSSEKASSSRSNIQGSQNTSTNIRSSTNTENRKDSRESARIERFMADTELPSPPIEGKTSDATVERRIVERIDGFDEAFEGAEKSGGSSA